jgi:hypothetical protein
VSATDKSNVPAVRYPWPFSGGSNFSSKTDFVAPGVNLVSSLPGGGFGPMTGTSMAAPIVTGAIAQVRQIVGPTTGLPRGNRSAADLVISVLKRNAGHIHNGQMDLTHVNLAAAIADASGLSSPAFPGFALPAGETPPSGTMQFPKPTGGDVIVLGNRPYTDEQVKTLQDWVQNHTGDNSARVIVKGDRDKIIVELKEPVDKYAIEQFSQYQFGTRARAYDRSLISGF